MKLTDKKPTEPGWYWCNFGWNHIVFVEGGSRKESLYWEELDEDENADGYLEEHTTMMYVEQTNCQWSKRLEEPK